jgi:hypothetical protein
MGEMYALVVRKLQTIKIIQRSAVVHSLYKLHKTYCEHTNRQFLIQIFISLVMLTVMNATQPPGVNDNWWAILTPAIKRKS